MLCHGYTEKLDVTSLFYASRDVVISGKLVIVFLVSSEVLLDFDKVFTSMVL